MNCPKCGRELLIGSDVCPICDMAAEDTPQNIRRNKKEDKKRRKEERKSEKKNKKLTLFGKLFIVGIIVLAAGLAVGITLYNLDRYVVRGEENGNAINGGIACESRSDYYYSAGKVLYHCNKNFGNNEIVDKSNSGSIGNLVYTSDMLFYTRDSGIYQFNPKTRTTRLLCNTGSELTVAGYSDYVIYYNDRDTVYRYEISENTYLPAAHGKAVFGNGIMYLACENEIWAHNIKNGEKTKFADITEYTVPAFVRADKLYCCDFRDLTVKSYDIKTKETADVFSASDHKNVSDVMHINAYRDDLLIRGENGIYRFNPQSNELSIIENLGFVQSTAVLSRNIYALLPDGKGEFADFYGNIEYSRDK